MLTHENRHSAFGGAVLGISVVAGMSFVLAACGQHQAPAASTPAPSTAAAAVAHPHPSASPAAAVASAAPAAAAQAQAKLAAMSVGSLLAAARTAYAQHRLVSPAGDNAMEYYEAVLAKDPGNQVAKDALREVFPFGVPDVEKAISQNDFAEATREIGVMAKADPTNYTLTLLRSKLNAQQKLQARQQQQKQQQQLVAQKASAQRAAAARAAEQQQATAARIAAQQAAAAKVAAAKPKPAAPTPAPAPKPVGVTRGAEVVKAAPAQYPIDAARNQTSGYAVVQFTVTARGSVTNVRVTDSSPRHVFDEAAINAVERSKYEPAMRDGQPVAAVLQRRVDFSFGG